jgi:hypothetical protein
MKAFRPPFLLFAASLIFAGALLVRATLLVRYTDSSPNSIDVANLTGEYDAHDNKGEFIGLSVASAEVADPEPSQVLGANNEEKRIEVNLSNQHLYAYEGDRLVYDFLVSTGKWYPTPTGTFKIWGKFRYTKMSGGSKERNTYYYLPNVPFVMFFSNDKIAMSRGFAIHGAYWHDNFGYPMSHGCINMKISEAGLLYEWALPDTGEKRSIRASEDNPGTTVIIYGETPRN